MAAGKYSFVIEQGTTVDFEIQYKDSNNNPIDLTGYSARMQLRPSVSSDAVYITLSSSLNPDGTGLNMGGSGGAKPTTSGSIGIFIASCTSSLFIFDTAYYDLEIYSGSMDCPITTRVLEGQIRLSKEVTR